MDKGILLDKDNDLQIINGSTVIGESKMQDAYVTLSLNQGELKDDPLAGVNLVRMIRGKADKEKMRKTVEIGLERVGIRFDDIKDRFSVSINKTEI